MSKEINYYLTEMLPLPADYYQYIFVVWIQAHISAIGTEKPKLEQETVVALMKEWCEENFDRGGWHVDENKISIVDEDYAMAFRLRWA